MKREGFTTLFVLIISAVCLPIIVFASQTIFIQAKLNSNRVNMIQGELNLETEINRIVYDENGINDSIIDIIKRYPDKFEQMKHTLPISSTLLENLSGELTFENKKNDSPKYKLKIDANYNDMSVSKTVSGSIFNREIDDCDNGLVCLQGRSGDYIEKIEDLLPLIPDSINKDFLPSGHSLIMPINNKDITINTKIGSSELVYSNTPCNKISIPQNKLLLVLKGDSTIKKSVTINSTDNSISPILYGIIYIENGDLTFIGKCNFVGLVIIKDGELKKEGEEISTITGKVVLNSFKDPREEIQINYGSGIYFKYAKYLAALIEPEIIKIEIE